MPSESDPLLPQYPSTPEISGSGFGRKPRLQSDQAHVVQDTDNDKENTRGLRDPSASPSPLRIILILFTSVVGLGLVISFLSSDGFRGRWKLPSTPGTSPDTSLVERVDKILSENPLFDGHNDLAILIRFLYDNRIYDPAFTKPFEEGGLKMHVDLPRLKAGGVGATFWSAFVPCPTNGTDFSDGAYVQSVSMTMSQIDLLRRLAAAYPQVISSPDLNSSSAEAAFHRDHLLISPIGIEGLHQIGNLFSNLRLYFSLGVRYATLTHNCHNAFADAALVSNASGTTVAAGPYWGGVSEKGKILVKEMNRLGMLVDLA